MALNSSVRDRTMTFIGITTNRYKMLWCEMRCRILWDISFVIRHERSLLTTFPGHCRKTELSKSWLDSIFITFGVSPPNREDLILVTSFFGNISASLLDIVHEENLWRKSLLWAFLWRCERGQIIAQSTGIIIHTITSLHACSWKEELKQLLVASMRLIPTSFTVLRETTAKASTRH